jgi:isoleucyl-tRNA synthetase
MYFKQIEAGKKTKDIGSEVLNYWKENDIFKKIMESKKNGIHYTFLEGPPTANGKPHVGHALTRTVKDTVLRYKTMNGYAIQRREAGWDCHGLPVELEAEKNFGFKTKMDIENYGIEKFNDYCRNSVFKYVEEWLEVDDLLGFWIDHSNAYVTLKNDYIESEWWALKTLFEKDILYRDYRISPYCPRCETTLSSHELAQGYKDTKDLSVYAKFKISDNKYILAWTTTPWTLPSNMFLAVNKNTTYAEVQYKNETIIVAKNLVKKTFGEDCEIKSEMKGQELIGLKYTRPITFLEVPKNSCVIVHGDHVNLEEGTGIVHTAPAFGSEDFQIGKEMKVSLINPVDLQGRFNERMLPWYGMFVKDADLEIVKYLKENNLALKSEKYSHSYPFCYRCDTPLLYYPIEAWFLRISEFRGELIKNNEAVNWVPNHIKNGRFGNFIEEAKDWNLSRNRYWGTPLPIWICKNGHTRAIGSISELTGLGVNPIPQDLHRPYVDNIHFPCEQCGMEMNREPYVIDTWFDSGSATYASLHYPFNKEKELELPVSFITEAIDQTRGWFYTMHVISSILFGKNAYENVFCLEFILDSEGRKMSKSKGNGVLAREMIDKFGPDASRLFFYTTAPWKPKPLVEKVVRETETKILGTLINIYNFFASNANLDSYAFSKSLLSENLLDKWLVSRVNSTIDKVRVSMDSFELSEAQTAIALLIDDTSNFYLRLSRRRFWENKGRKAKVQAYNSLFYAIDNICKMLAPIAPFTTEYIFRAMHPHFLSIHAEMYPEVDNSKIDVDLEEKIKISRSLLESVRKGRQLANIKGRQPVKEILLTGKGLKEDILEPIREELNCRDIRFIVDSERPVKKIIKPVFGKVAPILKDKIGAFNKFLEEINRQNEAGLISSSTGLSFEGFELPEGSIEITEGVSENYVNVKEEKFEIFINKEIDHDLEVEGMAREVIRRVQVMRKQMDLPYDAKINVSIMGENLVAESIENKREIIMSETLSNSLTFNTDLDSKGKQGEHQLTQRWDIDGKELILCVTVAQ